MKNLIGLYLTATFVLAGQQIGERDAFRLLQRATFGPVRTEVERVRSAGTRPGSTSSFGKSRRRCRRISMTSRWSGHKSTFSRTRSSTFGPSSTAGSDHAWGSHQLVIGGAVKGGEMYGKFPDLTIQGPDDGGDRGQWIPSTSLGQYAASLAAWFGVPIADLNSIVPNLANFSGPRPAFLG